MASLSERVCEPEVMDQPGIDPLDHRHALNGLKRVNLLSGTPQRIWDASQPIWQSSSRIRILDLACGGGDVTLGLAKLAQRSGRDVEIIGWDKSDTATATATEQAAHDQLSNVRFAVHDVLTDPIEPQSFDLVYCTLFMHHLSLEEAIALLKRMSDATRNMLIVDDLRRTQLGYWLAWWGCHLLTRSKVVHIDGPRSVRAAFTESEAKSIAQQAGLNQVKFQRHWPQRFLMSWNRPS